MNRQAWSLARIPFIGALVVFVFTIVIGILNGIDVYTPDHDTLMGHVHSGTLGWITQAFAGVAILAMLGERTLTEGEVKKARTVARWVTIAVILYVAAFFIGDAITDRIQRPITGSLLLVVLIWFSRWLFTAQRDVPRTVGRLGMLLASVAVVIGAVFGIVLGLVTAGRDIPGVSADIADGIAGAHPPAMVVGFLLLAAMAIIEWLLGDKPAAGNRAGVIQMWLLFLSGLVLIVAFALVLAGRLPAVPQPTRERYIARLPERPSAGDVDQLRLPVVFRGYRMDDVDSALTTLRNRIAELEAGSVAGPAKSPESG